VKAATLVIAAALVFGAGGWKQVTSSGGSNVDQVLLARTPDGVLHVAWQRATAPNSYQLIHTMISPTGQIGLAMSLIVNGWVGVQNPSLVVEAGHLRVFFGGQRTMNTGDPDQELETATSPDGNGWTLQGGPVVPVGAQAYGSPVSATVLPNGTQLEAWAGTLGTWVHAGLNTSSPNYDYQAPLGHYRYDPFIASNAAGQAMLAWYSNATGHLGVYAQGVNPANGAPLGGAINMPGTANMSVGMIGRTPIVARPGGGFYVAYTTGYPALNRIMLWRVGDGTSLVSKTTPNVTPTTTIAADPNGRLWVAWTDVINGSLHVLARRSNRQASYFGAVVDGGSPSAASSIYRLDANATAGAVDVFANTSIGPSSTSTFYRRVLPGLTLTASPAKLHKGKKSAVTFRVLDAREPVKGAKVRAGGRSDTTNAKGVVTFTVRGRGRSVGAVATAPRYTAGHLRLRVLRK
jgi:hypothetical protein